jgi:putative endonuclease
MSFEGKELGRRGEELAAAHLAQKGYQIIRRNYETKRGEIDIIAQDRETTVFVEVKTFQDNSWEGVTPAVNVTPAKQKQVIQTARYYLAEIGREPHCRFDVVAVVTSPELVIEHFEGAFTA